MKVFIDHSIFVGMHNSDEATRIACKNFFVKNIKKEMFLSFAQVGVNDEIMWGHHSRKEQLEYYPFQDQAHTDLNVKRIPYSSKDMLAYEKIKDLNLTDLEKLTLAMVISGNGVLYTINKNLLSLNREDIFSPELMNNELKFPPVIENLYKESMGVKISLPVKFKNKKINNFFDSSLFLGMHSRNEKIRVACKNFFIKNIDKKMGISLEHIGVCNEPIWNRSISDQDIYWPFMDSLHTIMKTKITGYNPQDINRSKLIKIDNLDLADKLLLGMVINRDVRLYTINKKLANSPNVAFISSEDNEVELNFPLELEKIYQDSLKVRV